jgi:hypothetical protein
MKEEKICHKTMELNEIPRVVTPPQEPQEGTLVKDGLTGKYMFFRFGEWNVVEKEKAIEILKNIKGE